MIVGQGAPRTCRCIETMPPMPSRGKKESVREHHAPVGALRPPRPRAVARVVHVREHHALGALRLDGDDFPVDVIGPVRERGLRHPPGGSARGLPYSPGQPDAMTAAPGARPLR